MNEQNNGAELIMCPYCGQFVMCDDEYGDPVSVCKCAAAVLERARRENVALLAESVLKCCGEECSQEFPLFEPVSSENMDIMLDVVDQISKGTIDKVVISFGDGTKVSITGNKVSRKKTSTAESVPAK